MKNHKSVETADIVINIQRPVMLARKFFIGLFNVNFIQKDHFDSIMTVYIFIFCQNWNIFLDEKQISNI